MLKLRIALMALALCSFTSTALAQTPRDAVIDFIISQSNSPAKTLLKKTPANDEPIITNPIFENPQPSSEPHSSTAITPTDTSILPPENGSASALTEAPIAISPRSEPPTSIGPTLPGRENSDKLPFFIGATAYKRMRKGGGNEHMVLTYAVTAYDQTLTLKPEAQTVTLRLGTGYAALKKEATTRIFDFANERFLTLSETATQDSFTNISLYPAVLKKIEAVNRLTQGGQKDSVTLSGQTTLSSTWIESAMSLQTRSKINDLNVNKTGNVLTVAIDEETALTTEFSDIPYANKSVERSFAGFIVHRLPIHPQAIGPFMQTGKIPKTMDMVSYGPGFSQGRKELWTLTASRIEKGGFPLPDTARSTVEQDTVSPLAFVIASAAQGTARGGRPIAKDMRRAMNDALEAEDPVLAWLLAQRLKEMIDNPLQALGLTETQTIIAAEYEAATDISLIKTSFETLASPEARIAAFKALLPLTKQEGVPAMVLRQAGRIRSRIRPRDAQAAGLSDIAAKALLEAALAADPYDPISYQALGQIYAAQGKTVDAWDMFDALRFMPDTPEALTKQINRTENRLKKRAPHFF